MEVASVAEAVRALCYLIPGFEEALREGAYKVLRVYPDKIHQIGEEQISLNLGKASGIRIEPVVAGGKKKGLGKIILGVALIGAAFAFSGGALAGTAFSIGGMGITYGRIALTGGLMLLSGISQMLQPKVKSNLGNTDNEIKSFIFDGPENSIEQGKPIPLVYGQIHAGSIVVSTGITTEELPI